MNKKRFDTNFDSFLGEKRTQVKSNKNVQNETKATFKIQEIHLEKLRAISFFEKKMIKDVLSDALKEYFKEYEKANGEIQLPKKYTTS